MTADDDATTRDPDDWETVGREALYCRLWGLVDDAHAAVDHAAGAVLFDGDVSAEEVARMRQYAFAVVWTTEAHLARVCVETEPWDADAVPYAREPGDARPDPLPSVSGQQAAEADADARDAYDHDAGP